MVEPTIIAGVAVVAVVALGAVYSYVSGRGSSVDVDTDSDGESELSASFEGEDDESSSLDDIFVQDDLTTVKGIQETREQRLKAAGFQTVEDLRQASDEELEGVKGIGPYTVEQIRSDIGE